MAAWMRLLQLCIHSSLLISVAEATIECMCSTADCLRDGTVSCQATYTCYVQYMAPAWADPQNQSEGVVRGCIDDSTPLLCENRRPLAFTGSWPVLHCCQEDWCNKDVMPTPPAWLQDVQERESSKEDPVFGDEESDISEDYAYSQIDSSSGSYRNNRAHRARRTINPLYVAVPVAGACVLLAIIIFAIFVLRRQNSYMDEYRYPTTLSRGPPPNCCQDKKCMYAESERSSTGSETKLLVRV